MNPAVNNFMSTYLGVSPVTYSKSEYGYSLQRINITSPVLGIDVAHAFSMTVCAVAGFLGVNYVYTLIRFHSSQPVGQIGQMPPTIPYAIPFIGSALKFAIDPYQCIQEASRYAGLKSAYGVKVLSNTLYFLTGPTNVAKIRKYKTSITDPGVQTFCLIRVFGMPKKAVAMYTLDNSGILPKPRLSSNVASHNRIDFHTHAGFNHLLSGDRLINLYKRWLACFTPRLERLQIGNEWISVADIMDYWMPSLTAALNEAMAGPVLECINPNFTQDFLEFLPYVHGLMKGLPRWWLPRAFALRESLNRDFRQWHSLARTFFKESDISPDGDADPWWGCAAMRERQKLFEKVDNWGHDAMAASDFGLLWGAALNVHTAAIWTVIEVFKDPALLARVRHEIESSLTNSSNLGANIELLLSLPLLQSIYAEVLRLRVEVQSVFVSQDEDILVNQWRFPKHNLLLVPTGPAHMDPKVWYTQGGTHPVGRFWADRFLIRSDEPQSGPVLKKNAKPVPSQPESKTLNDSSNELEFVSSGISDSFMPYGVGERTCPGRLFARREIVAFCATLVMDYDIEILNMHQHYPSSSIFHGLGVQRSLHKIPFRIKKRHAN